MKDELIKQVEKKCKSSLPVIYEFEGKLGFNHDGFFITDPFVSTCGRFDTDPIIDYGLSDKQVEIFIKGEK